MIPIKFSLQCFLMRTIAFIMLIVRNESSFTDSIFPFVQPQSENLRTSEQFIFMVESGIDELFSVSPLQNCSSSSEHFITSSAVIQVNDEEPTLNLNTFHESVIVITLKQISSLFLKLNAISDHLNSTLNLRMLIIITQINDDASSMVKSDIENSSEIERELFQQYFTLGSRIYIAFWKNLSTNSECLNSEVWEIYFIQTKIFMNQVLEANTFSDLNKLWDTINFHTEKPAFARRQEWNGVELHCSFFLLEPPADETQKTLEDGATGIDRFEVNARTMKDGTSRLELLPSLSARIFWDFQAALNFTYVLKTPFDLDQGLQDAYNDPNQTFDIILSHFGIVPEKHKFAQHLLPTYFNGIYALYVQPPIHSIRNIFSRPLSMGMWMMIATSWLLLIISFKFILWLRTLLQLDSIDEEKEIDEKVGKDIWWWAIAAACQQGWYVTPVSLPTRLVFITGLGFSLLCYASYTAEIVSQLWGTNQPITDLDTLMSFTNEILMGDDQDVVDMIKQRMGHQKKFISKIRQMTEKDAVERVLKKNRGYSCYLGWSDYFISNFEIMMNGTNSFGKPFNVDQEYCKDVHYFKFTYLPIQVSMFVRKNSPYTKTFNYRIISGREKGFIQRYWREYILNTNIFCLKEGNTTYALGLWDTWAAFAILVFGYGLSILILVLEILKKQGRDKTDFNMIM